MKTFKQFLNEETIEDQLARRNAALRDTEGLLGLDSTTSKKLEQLRQNLSKMSGERDYTGASKLFSEIDNALASEAIGTARMQNLKVQQVAKDLTFAQQDIDTTLPPALQQKQKENRRIAYEREGLVPPADDVTTTVHLHGSSPTTTDIASRAAAGESNAMQLRTDEKGRLRNNLNNLKALSAAGLAVAGSVAGSALTQGAQAATDVLGMMGTTPAPKDRMQVEKDYGSDIGLGFNLTPEGELEADPQGREAARKRQQRGVNFGSMFKG